MGEGGRPAAGSTGLRIDPADAAAYRAAGWWGDDTLGAVVRRHAAERPDSPAYVVGDEVTSWRRYDELADSFARLLAGCGLPVGARVGVQLSDGALLHALFVGCERAGLVAVGVGLRAGDAEVAHLLGKTGAVAFVCAADFRGRAAGELLARLDEMGVRLTHHVEVGAGGAVAAYVHDGAAVRPAEVRDVPDLPARALGADDLFLLNSTSGTTGLPKCVTQFPNRWMYFHQLAVRAGELRPDDVFMSLIPGPFGFGLWTAHVTPAVLGAPCVLQPRFDAAEALRLIERHRVSVLACVSTQFVMMLNSPELDRVDLSSLRCMFTGGENVPYEKALEWEQRTGSLVLQFFGSNESGAFSHTSTTDTVEQRLLTAGKLIPEMQVRLFDDDGNDVTATGGPGQPGGRGPALCGGYWNDEAANRELYTPDGWLLMGDLVTVDADGYVRVVGRKSDFIIRGGKNISAAALESELATHPAVDLAAAIPVPDPVFGEKVCAVLTLRDGADSPALADLVDHLAARGVGKESFPEYLVVVDSMPCSSGGKVAKGDLRRDVLDLLAREQGVALPG